MTIPEAVQLDHPGRQPGARRRDVRARDGRAGEDHRPRAQHDPAVGPGARTRSRSRSSAPRPGEKLREELFDPGERAVPTDADRILRAERVAARPGVGRGGLRAGRAARGAPATRPSSPRRWPSSPARSSRRSARRRRTAPARTSRRSRSSSVELVERVGAYVGLAAFLGLASSPCSTSRRRATCGGCAIGPAARPSGRSSRSSDAAEAERATEVARDAGCHRRDRGAHSLPPTPLSQAAAADASESRCASGSATSTSRSCATSAMAVAGRARAGGRRVRRDSADRRRRRHDGSRARVANASADRDRERNAASAAPASTSTRRR